MSLRSILEKVPDPRGRQGRKHALWSILALIVVSMLCGRKGCAAAFRLGREMTARQRRWLEFPDGKSPCHSTLTTTLDVLDIHALADALGSWVANPDGDGRHVAIDGKTLRASADGETGAAHVLSAFCIGLSNVIGAESSRGHGMELPDAIALLKRLDLKEKVVTADALFCQKEVCSEVVKHDGDYVIPVKDNQPTLREDIETAFNEPVVPMESHDSGFEKGHGRIERRTIDVLPSATIGPIAADWPGLKQVCRVTRFRQTRFAKVWREPTVEVTYLIASLPSEEASPADLLHYNRRHWGIEVMHRDKDVLLDEDHYTNRKGRAPHNVFLLTAFVLKILRSASNSATVAVEMFQDNKNRAISLFQ